MPTNLHELNMDIAAYEKVLHSYAELLEKFGGSDEYIEQRIHFLNCKYADLLVLRLNLRETPMECIPSSESRQTVQRS